MLKELLNKFQRNKHKNNCDNKQIEQVKEEEKESIEVEDKFNQTAYERNKAYTEKVRRRNAELREASRRHFDKNYKEPEKPKTEKELRDELRQKRLERAHEEALKKNSQYYELLEYRKKHPKTNDDVSSDSDGMDRFHVNR